MKVRITRNTVAQKRQVMAGEELDVSKEEALELIGANKAVAIKEEAAETTDAPAEDVETTTPTGANTETFAATVKGKKKKGSE